MGDKGFDGESRVYLSLIGSELRPLFANDLAELAEGGVWVLVLDSWPHLLAEVEEGRAGLLGGIGLLLLPLLGRPLLLIAALGVVLLVLSRLLLVPDLVLGGKLVVLLR